MKRTEFQTHPRTIRQLRIRRAVRIQVSAGFALMGISGLIWGSFGLFLVALQSEFGWSRGEISGVFATFALANAITAPLIGAAMARWSSRHLLSLLTLLLGGALTLTATHVSSIAGYWAIFGVAGGIGAQCVSSFVIFSLLARRVRRNLATAMSISDAGSGLATMLGLPFLQFVIDVWGWRAAYGMLATLIFVVVLFLHLAVFDSMRRAQQALPPSSIQALSLGRFAAPSSGLLLMCVSYFCGSAAYHGLLTQQIALFNAEGISPAQAVWIAAIAGGAVFIWRLASGWLCDLIGVVWVLGVATLAVTLTILGLFLVLWGYHFVGTAIYPFALAIGFGGQQVLLAVALRGLASPVFFAGNLAYGRLASGLGMASGPVVGGFAYDLTGSSLVVVLLIGALSLVYVSTFMLVTLQPVVSTGGQD